MSPEHVYYAMMFFGALPLAWVFRDVPSLAVFLTWGVGHIAYTLGFPEPETQIAIYLVAFGVLGYLTLVKLERGLFTAFMFFPLALTCILWQRGIITHYQAWWTIYWLALTQAASLPFNIDWQAAFRRWRARSKGGGGRDMHQLVRA